MVKIFRKEVRDNSTKLLISSRPSDATAITVSLIFVVNPIVVIGVIGAVAVVVVNAS
jgi:hypothetical protein